jgi:hypothetical protein
LNASKVPGSRFSVQRFKVEGFWVQDSARPLAAGFHFDRRGTVSVSVKNSKSQIANNKQITMTEIRSSNSMTSAKAGGMACELLKVVLQNRYWGQPTGHCILVFGIVLGGRAGLEI